MKRLSTIALAATLAAGLNAAPAMAFDPAAMSETERLAFGEAVRTYLLENPEIIIEAVSILEARQANAQATADADLISANAAAIYDDGFSWVGGNPDGDVTLVEFLDYRCPYCRRAHAAVAGLMKRDPNVRLIVKEFPILGEASLAASRFAISVRQNAGPDAYHQVSDALMEFNGDINDVTLRRLAEGLGLNVDAIMAGMNAESVTAELTATRELGKKLNITGTPTFVLEDEMLRGFVPEDQLTELVAGKRG
ncbi:MAG: DsbA family protein [Marinibacterium sp.]